MFIFGRSISAVYKYIGTCEYIHSFAFVHGCAAALFTLYGFGKFLPGKYRAAQLDHNALREACFNQPECSKRRLRFVYNTYQPIKTLKTTTAPDSVTSHWGGLYKENKRI